MKYKMLAVDLDDTVVGKDGHISDAVIQALQQATKKGVYVVLATGRPIGGITHVAKQLQLNPQYSFHLGFNGGHIMDATHTNTIYHQGLTHSSFRKLFTFAKEKDVSLLTYTDTSILCSKRNHEAECEQQLTTMPLDVNPNYIANLPQTLTKAMIVEEHQVLLSLEEDLRNLLQDELFITFSKPFFLECMCEGVNKGAGLLHLAKTLEIDASEIIAIGDSDNDLSMLAIAGCGVAMGNAKEHIKQQADYVCEHIDEDGVAKTIQKFIL